MAIRRFVVRPGSRLGGVVLFLTLSGCGPGRGDLSGTVSYQGKILRFGSISVVGSDGIPRTEPLREDGSFLLQNLRAGTIKVAVISQDRAESQPKARKKGAAQPKIDRTGWFAIPEKYNDFEKSELTYTLRAGPNRWTIDLK
jgi:hypothetical protein